MTYGARLLAAGANCAAILALATQPAGAQQARSLQETRQSPDTTAAEIGQRQEREDLVEIVQPHRRINSRLETRISSRLQTRIERNADPEAQLSAEARIRAATQVAQQTPTPQQ